MAVGRFGWCRVAALCLANLIFDSVEAAQVKLAWTRSPDPAIVAQKLYYGFATNGLDNVVTIPASASSAILSTLLDARLYYFAVTAVNGYQIESDKSDPVAFITRSLTAPFADSKTISTGEDQAVIFLLTGSDPNGGVLSFSVATPPKNGMLIGLPPLLVYRPNTNFSGVDSFTYTAFNGWYRSIPATVTINVVANDVPTLASIPGIAILTNSPTQVVSLTGISAGVNEYQPLTITATSSNPGLIFPAVSYTSPNSSGFLSFKPAPNQFGSATITVRVSDGLTNTQRSFLVNVKLPPPIVSNALEASNDARTITIGWTTDQPTTCVLEYGPDATYGSFSESTSGSNHSVTLFDLAPATTYYLQVRADNNAGSVSYTPIGTAATEPINVITRPAESATLTSPFSLYTHSSSLDGKHISSPQAELGRATFSLTVPDGLNYRLWARVRAPIGGGSLYLSVDGGAEYLFSIPPNGSANPYRWVQLINGANEVLLPLGAGFHRLAFRGGVANTQLDEIILCNDPSWLPLSPASEPQLLLTTPSNTSVILTWDAMADNADYVNIEVSTDGYTFTRYATLPGSQTKLTIQNLYTNKNYYFRMFAYDPLDKTAYSNVAERPAVY